MAGLTYSTALVRPCLSFAPTVLSSLTRRYGAAPGRRLAENAAAVAASSPSAGAPASAEAKATAPPTRKRRVRRILSGVQPTGSLHLGNYLGAIKQWVEFQDTGEFAAAENLDGEEFREDDDGAAEVVNENFFCVVDLHAITVPQDPGDLEESTLASAALYIAAGIDPAKSRVFVQSHVPAHAELAWLLNCATPMNWLERMIQYKDKAGKAGTESVGVGLFTYPVLMAADILLYQADRVPVGEDQRQHLELARDIVRRFNGEYCRGNQYKKRCKRAGLPSRPAFTEPEAMIVRAGGARVMSLTDGTKKMSKSDPADGSRINVLDPPDLIRDKVRRCKTDSLPGIEWDNPDRPESTNLLNIYAAVQPNRTREDILDEVGDMRWGDFKPLLAEAVVDHLGPIQARYAEVRADEAYLRGVLADGADAAGEIAGRTLRAAKVSMGFSLPAE